MAADDLGAPRADRARRGEPVTFLLDRVAKLMREHDCGAIPVRDGKKLVGMITDRDICLALAAASVTPADRH